MKVRSSARAIALPSLRRARRSTIVAASVFALAALVVAGGARAETPRADRPACSAPADLVRLPRSLPRFAEAMAGGRPVKIVAFGSSSTSGIGASAPGATYPARLEADLRRLDPGRSITVVNRGMPGDETRDELRRFERDVLDEKPDLVVWQLGTNALLAGRDPGAVSLDVMTGIDLLRRRGADVVLMNPQYSPRVLDRPTHPEMLEKIAATGREAGVDVFDRFAIMRFWARDLALPFPVFMSDDGLHMNDWSYACLAELLAKALVQTATPAAARR